MKNRCPNRNFVKEVLPWLDKSMEYCRLVLDFFDLSCPRQVLKDRVTEYLKNKTEVCTYEIRLLEQLLI